MRKKIGYAALSAWVVLTVAGCERPKAKGMEQAPQGPVPVTVSAVGTGDYPMTLEANGQTQGANSAQIFARVSGYLQKINYTEGSKVEAGQTLFTLDPADLINARDNAKAAMMQAQASYDNAVVVLNRVRPLAEAHASSQQELDSAVTAEKTAAAVLTGAKAAYAQAKLNLGYATIKAPIGGYADKRKIDLGTYVTPGTNGLLTTVYQTDPMYVNFSLSENQKIIYQNAIAAGKLVAPRGNSYDVRLTLGDGTTVDRTGTINFVAPFFDTATGTISYRATIKNGDSKLLPGQFVRVSIKGMSWKNAVSVPQGAVLTSDKGKFVYLLEANNTVTPRPVQLGDWIGDKVVVIDGLKGGEAIVVDGLTKLKPGAAVIPAKTH